MAGSSSAGMVDHSFDLQVGGGIQIKISDRFSLQLVPTEYNLRKMPRINFFTSQLHHA
jgi:uncharacterized SAM-dependent methyltransferase